MNALHLKTKPPWNEISAAPLVFVNRGDLVESIHRGHVAVVNPSGRLIASTGDPDGRAFLRSCAKFHQAMPMIESGAADRFGFAREEVAIACASHQGEPFQVALVRSMLGKLGLDERALKCGPQIPSSENAARELVVKGITPGAIHNNCSGKHAGMLAASLQLGVSIDTYVQPSHPVQRRIAAILQQFSGLNEIQAATDGCSLPTFYMAVSQMAGIFACLAAPPAQWGQAIPEHIRRIWNSVSEFPQVLSNYDGLDAQIVKIGAGRILAKGGAEAVFCMAIRPCTQWPEGLGVAIKVEDGSGSRAHAPVVFSVIEQLGILDSAGLDQLRRIFPEEIYNRAGVSVGRLSSVVKLKFTAESA